ncbi:MAG: hypothetical protein JSR59_14870 [Proteobacteria bacterium]|nr:hypothetical protein [Pseudomonadota bacterium]
MVELAILILCVCMVFALLRLKNPGVGRASDDADPNDLESAFVVLKKLALTPPKNVDEEAYRRLLHRIDGLVGRIVERHLQFLFRTEAKAPDIRRALGLDDPAATLRDIDIAAGDPEVLLYLCFFLYLGGTARDLGKVDGDAELMMRILDDLVRRRGYPPAQFFLGLVMKYGVRADLPGNLAEARRLLHLAVANGVDAAALELRGLDKHAPLRRLAGVRPDGVPRTA